MHRHEREDLQRLIRQREKVLKSAAKQRTAELIAEFENHLGTVFKFDDDAIWSEATKIAEREVDKANAIIAARCAELGIPKRFSPSISIRWFGRNESAVKERRAELRAMATTRIEAIERDAITKIELASLEAQTQIATSGLTSDAAKAFVTRMPSVEELMKPLTYEEIAGEAEPPIVEQLVSPAALRQRRYRERQAARNAVTSLPRNGDASDLPEPAADAGKVA